MDQVNSAEGRVYDYHQTRWAAHAWRDMAEDAARDYDQDPVVQQHFKNKKAYVASRIAESVLTPVQIRDELRLMDSREVTYYQSLENVEKARKDTRMSVEELPDTSPKDPAQEALD